MLLLLLRAAAHNISTEAERGPAYCFFLLRLRYYYCCFLCVYSIAVAAVEKGYAFLFKRSEFLIDTSRKKKSARVPVCTRARVFD